MGRAQTAWGSGGLEPSESRFLFGFEGRAGYDGSQATIGAIVKRRWRAAASGAAGTWFLRMPIVPERVAAEIQEERLYWQRRAVADRAAAIANFQAGVAVRVGERDVRRAVLEGELACLEMLERVDRQTAEAALPKRGSFAWLHAEVSRPFEPATPEMLRAHAEAQRQLLAAKRLREEEWFFGRDPGPSPGLSEWICSNKNPLPSVPLTRETFELAFEAAKKFGYGHGVIRHTGLTG